MTSARALAGQVVTFAGRLLTLARKDAVAQVVRLGGSVETEVTERTKLLVVAADASPPGAAAGGQAPHVEADAHNGREYVGGGLTSPIPVKVARSLGADVVIAVDISSRPKYARVSDSVDVMLQTFSIMGQSIGQHELAGADVVIRPNTGAMGSTDFEQKHQAIMEGEKAALAALPLIRSAIQRAAARQAGDARH